MGNRFVSVLKKVLFAAAVAATVAAVNPQNAEAATKVKMDRTKVTCTAKECFRLKVKGVGRKKITWSSTNKSVAMVYTREKDQKFLDKKFGPNNTGSFIKSSECLIVTKKAGKATIKAKVGSKTVKCKATVKKNAKRPWLTTKAKTLHVGESFLLIEGWFTDYESVFSFNDRIAIADGSGRITATGVGTVKILVNRGQDSNGKYRDYFCTVTVVPGAAKTCKHCWMDEKNSKGSLVIKNFREEGYEMCHICGEKFVDVTELKAHKAGTGHIGTMTAGGGDGSSVVKFCFPVGKSGVVQQYCRTCGEVK